MSLTRGNLIDRCAGLFGDDSTGFREYAAVSLDNMLYYLWDCHDWEFKHKAGTFSTVSGTESYDLSVSSTDIRSAQDVEVLYDTTNGRFIKKIDLKDIRKAYPKEDSSGQPIVYAPWGTHTIYLHDEPNGVYVMKYLYLSTPTTPTDDDDDLLTDCGVPLYMQYLVEKLLMAEMALYYDDTRYTAMINEIESRFMPRAIAADMKHLESGARFKMWEEEIAITGQSYDDFLRHAWWGDRGY